MNFNDVKNLTIPEGNVKEITDSAGNILWKLNLVNYTYLKLIDRSISGTYTNETVERIGKNAFKTCSKLTEINFPSAMSIEANAFQGCSSLTTVDLSATTNIGEYAFENCYGLTSANFLKVTAISGQAFQHCVSLSEINFPLMTSIGWGAFRGCSNLTIADFPVVTSIDQYAFADCSKLVSLILRSETIADIYGNSFYGTPIESGTGHIYVPATLIDSYKTATNWHTYTPQIRAIEDYPEITGGKTNG